MEGCGCQGDSLSVATDLERSGKRPRVVKTETPTTEEDLWTIHVNQAASGAEICEIRLAPSSTIEQLGQCVNNASDIHGALRFVLDGRAVPCTGPPVSLAAAGLTNDVSIDAVVCDFDGVVCIGNNREPESDQVEFWVRLTLKRSAQMPRRSPSVPLRKKKRGLHAAPARQAEAGKEKCAWRERRRSLCSGIRTGPLSRAGRPRSLDGQAAVLLRRQKGCRHGSEVASWPLLGRGRLSAGLKNYFLERRRRCRAETRGLGADYLLLSFTLLL